MQRFNITAVKANGPGALDGYRFKCARSGCPEVAGFSLRSLTEDHARGHERWHKAKDHARQPFARIAS